MAFQGNISATFTDGVFKPDERPDLPEGARVTISVRDGAPTAESRRRGWELIDRIRRDGLVRLGGEGLTRDDLYDRR